MKNKHGLSRTVPAVVKREIRQRCGFGCVICGFAFYEYEHFSPDFVDAREHNPKGMTLLCSQCNQKRARGRLSASTVALANENPICRQRGFASEMFDFHSAPLEITFAGANFYDCQNLIIVNERPILSIQSPITPGGPLRLSGVFCDKLGRESLSITENEWSVDSGSWDVECEGPLITIRRAPRDIMLAIRLNSPRGIIIEKIDMLFEGVRFKGGKDFLKFSVDDIHWTEFSSVGLMHGNTGLMITSRTVAANDSSFVT